MRPSYPVDRNPAPVEPFVDYSSQNPDPGQNSSRTRNSNAQYLRVPHNFLPEQRDAEIRDRKVYFKNFVKNDTEIQDGKKK